MFFAPPPPPPTPHHNLGGISCVCWRGDKQQWNVAFVVTAQYKTKGLVHEVCGDSHHWWCLSSCFFQDILCWNKSVFSLCYMDFGKIKLWKCANMVICLTWSCFDVTCVVYMHTHTHTLYACTHIHTHAYTYTHRIVVHGWGWPWWICIILHFSVKILLLTYLRPVITAWRTIGHHFWYHWSCV